MKDIEKLISTFLDSSGAEYEEYTDKLLKKFKSSKISEEEKKIIKDAFLLKSRMLLKEAEQSVKESDELIKQFETSRDVSIHISGDQYNLKEWLTLKDYCREFKVQSTMVVTNWIKRGIVPAENVLVLRELNNLKLIKAVPYK